MIANNVLDARIAARDGAAGAVTGNYTTAAAAFFVAPSIGICISRPASSAVLDKVAAPLAAAGADWDGQLRPPGATDLGADEYMPPGTTPPAVPRNLRIIRQ